MFAFNEKLTLVAAATQAVLANCGLRVDDPLSDESFALVVYRKDPLDQNFYLSGFAGLRHSEPMFGPSNYTDFKLTLRQLAENPFGFRTREGTVWVDPVDRQRWQLHVNGRPAADRGHYERVKDRLLADLSAILDTDATSARPLYPELWHMELLARDRLRDSYQTLQPGAALEDVAQRLCKGIDDVFVHLLPHTASVHVGLYLDTGDSWTLCSGNAMAPWLPTSVNGAAQQQRANPDLLNAFDWVSQSTRSLRFGQRLSSYWSSKLQACDHDFVRAITEPQFSGLAIVPVPHPSYPWRCMGIVSATVLKATLLPAHVYLLNRLAVGVAGYLVPLMPIPGFPWWPEARLSRGGASVTWEKGKGPTTDSAVPTEVTERAISELMPKGSTVKAATLRSGHSGTEVVRLAVTDRGGNPEVPRVLKIGDPATVADELQRYYRYVHNKRIGGASRVDVARGFWVPSKEDGVTWKPIGRDFGAIVYTLVGAGDPAHPWTQWATQTNEREFGRALDLLFDLLIDWYNRTKPQQGSAVDLLIRPLADGQLQDYMLGTLRDPSFHDISALLSKIAADANKRRLPTSKSAISHGDLHADNVFAVISPSGSVSGVALIDWGNVTSKYHALSDISKLAADLEFRVNVDVSISNVANGAVRVWGQRLGCGERDWQLAMINQLARLLFYRSGPWRAPGSLPNSLLSPDARSRAWSRLQELARDFNA